MRIGINVDPYRRDGLDVAIQADRMGVDSLWAPEAWGYDAFTPLAYVAARTERARLVTGVAQLGARTPAMLAMSAMSMQALSQGRFVLGLGVSGPQVMEGWHGVRFANPMARTRETIEIVRQLCRGERSSYAGSQFQLPLPGSEGKAIRSMVPPTDVPIFVAALGPSNLRLTGQLADGWVGNSFMAGVPESAAALVDPIRQGAEAAGRSLDDVELTVAVSLEFDDDLEAVARRHAGGYAFTFGAMGSGATNFYSAAFDRQGFGPQVEEVRRLWRNGDREGAARAVPPEIGMATNLLGTDETVTRALQAFEAAGISTLRVTLPEGVRTSDGSDGTRRSLDELERLLTLC